MSWGVAKAYDDPEWAKQGKVWVEVSPGRMRLVDLNKPRPIAPARSDFPMPYIVSDSLKEEAWGADGRLHDTRSGYLHSLKPEGNAEGEEYHILSEGEYAKADQPKVDYGARRDQIKEAIKDVEYGRVPPPVLLED